VLLASLSSVLQRLLKCKGTLATRKNPKLYCALGVGVVGCLTRLLRLGDLGCRGMGSRLAWPLHDV
jgi:hypothetical protein